VRLDGIIQLNVAAIVANFYHMAVADNLSCQPSRITAPLNLKANGDNVMALGPPADARRARLIVVGNEKGGSGKSTVAMHVAIALLKSKQSVATLDLDGRHRTFTHYIENRYAWARDSGLGLEIPRHIYFVENMDHPTAEDEAADGNALIDQINALAGECEFIVIDTPGRDSYLGRLAHAMADTLITPLNDSFVDLDVLGTVDRETLRISGPSHYAQMVAGARQQRQLRNASPFDWIVLRNRLSSHNSRNTRCVALALDDLARMLGFRCVDGIAERVIFREFDSRGLTALDSLDATTLGVRPTLSHATARLEVDNLLRSLNLPNIRLDSALVDQTRDAA
jgi:chromosome partitioning protein